MGLDEYYRDPQVSGWMDGKQLARQSWEYPLVEPVVLDLLTAKKEKDPEGPRSYVCAEVTPLQGPGCLLRTARGKSHTVDYYTPGTKKYVDVAAGTDSLLSCLDGSVQLQTLDAGCDDVELEPYGAVCVVHEPALRCDLMGPEPHPHTSVHGCNGEVTPGTWKATCHGGEVDGEIEWVKCDDIVVTAGETTDLRCW